jgi:hypothetical protein
MSWRLYKLTSIICFPQYHSGKEMCTRMYMRGVHERPNLFTFLMVIVWTEQLWIREGNQSDSSTIKNGLIQVKDHILSETSVYYSTTDQPLNPFSYRNARWMIQTMFSDQSKLQNAWLPVWIANRRLHLQKSRTHFDEHNNIKDGIIYAAIDITEHQATVHSEMHI